LRGGYCHDLTSKLSHSHVQVNSCRWDNCMYTQLYLTPPPTHADSPRPVILWSVRRSQATPLSVLPSIAPQAPHDPSVVMDHVVIT
jgi:hypothetical protein